MLLDQVVGEFIEKHLQQLQGGLWRTSSADGAGKLNGYLEDYAAVADAYTYLYEATFDNRWLESATAGDVCGVGDENRPM